jgi:hypothetical protein
LAASLYQNVEIGAHWLVPISSRRTKSRNVRAHHANAAPAKVDDPDTRVANADVLLQV